MTARTGMSDLILDVRAKAFAGTADFSVSGVTYFTDNQLQEVLDEHRFDIFRESLKQVSTLTDGGSAQWFDYFFTAPFVERAESGATAWELETTGGSAIGTADYSIEYEARRIKFNVDTKGTAYMLTYRSYNVYKSAAQILYQKAAQAGTRFDVKVDNHSLRLSQLIGNYIRMAAVWENRQGSKTVDRVRTDVVRNADL